MDVFSIVGFGSTPEDLKGELRLLRVERQDYPAGAGHWYLQSVDAFHRGGKRSESSFYYPDGRQSSRETYTYGEDGRLLRTVVYNDSGTPHLTWEHSVSADGQARESVAYTADGAARERSITRSNEAGQVLEATSIDLLHDNHINLDISYDSQGRPVRGEAQFERSPELNFVLENDYFDDGTVASTLRGVSGELFRVHESGTGRGLSQMLTSGAGQVTIERIDARDEKGNWTQMTLSRGASATDCEPYALLRRTIVYY